MDGVGHSLALRHRLQANRPALEAGRERAVRRAGLEPRDPPVQHGAGPDEGGYEGRIRVPEDLVGAAQLGDPSLREHRHDITEPERLVEIVGHLQRGDVLPGVNRPELPAEHLAGGRIDRGKRLVEEQDGGAGRERTRERHALGLAAAQLVDRAVEQRRDAEERGELPHAVVLRGGIERAGGEAVADVVADVEMGEEVVALVYEAHAAPLRREGGHVGAMQLDPAPERPDVSGHGLEQGGLS